MNAKAMAGLVVLLLTTGQINKRKAEGGGLFG